MKFALIISTYIFIILNYVIAKRCTFIPYKLNNQICCPGVNHTNTAGVCCGREFDPKMYMCCFGSVLRRHPRIKHCCKSRRFIPERQRCCNGEVFNRDFFTKYGSPSPGICTD